MLQVFRNTELDQSARVFALRYFLKLDRNTYLAQAVDTIMACAKKIYILMTKVSKLIFFFVSQYFLKEIENMWKFERTHVSITW